MLYEHLSDTCLTAGGVGLRAATRIHGSLAAEPRGNAA